MSELWPNCFSHSYGLVPHIFSDESNKLETYIYVSTKKNFLNTMVGFILKYLIFILSDQQQKRKKYQIYIYIYI